MSALSLVAAAVLLAADPEKPVDFSPKDVPALADPKAEGHKAAKEKYEGKLVKITAKVAFNSGVAAGRPYESFYIHFGDNTPGRYLVVGVEWATEPAAERLKKQVEKKGRDGLSLTVYGRLSDIGNPSGGTPTFSNSYRRPPAIAFSPAFSAVQPSLLSAARWALVFGRWRYGLSLCGWTNFPPKTLPTVLIRAVVGSHAPAAMRNSRRRVRGSGLTPQSPPSSSQRASRSTRPWPSRWPGP
jgi:hypothetical protein